MKVFLATISHRHSTNVYAARTEGQMFEKLAQYCIENWDEAFEACDQCGGTGEIEGIGNRAVPCEMCVDQRHQGLVPSDIVQRYFESMGDYESYDTTWDEI